MRLQREARSWSQMELAYRAKISQAKLSGIETGSSRSGVRADTLRDLALALEVPADYLLGLTDRSQPYPPAETDRV